jgi:DNA polymerase zeta
MFIPSQLQVLRRVLDARQLGLKYIANVTYGYTSASFSGRMPAVEIADSIVQSGRETLEKVCPTYNSWLLSTDAMQ